MQLSNDAIRAETRKVLKSSPLYARAQQRLDSATPAHCSRARPGELRKRVITSRVVQEGTSRVRGNANGDEEDDDEEANLERLHDDTFTEGTSAPGSPRSDVDAHNGCVHAPSSASAEHQPLDRGEFDSPLFSFVVDSEDLDGEEARRRLFQWLKKCSQSMVQGLGALCLAPVNGVVGWAQQCAAVLQDVVSWCYRGIQEIHRRGMKLYLR